MVRQCSVANSCHNVCAMRMRCHNSLMLFLFKRLGKRKGEGPYLLDVSKFHPRKVITNPTPKVLKVHGHHEPNVPKKFTKKHPQNYDSMAVTLLKHKQRGERISGFYTHLPTTAKKITGVWC